jgi:hypothetical protein
MKTHAAYSENRAKNINEMFGQNGKLLNVKACAV